MKLPWIFGRYGREFFGVARANSRGTESLAPARAGAAGNLPSQGALGQGEAGGGLRPKTPKQGPQACRI